MHSADDVIAAVAAVADPERAASSASFFKTGPGDYGEGDVFVGVRVPQLRRMAKQFKGIDSSAVRELLASKVHEHRHIALVLLRNEFERSSEPQTWVDLYLEAVRAGRVNNWDLVDCSADPILGEWLYRTGDHTLLGELVAEDDLWRRRVGIVGTFAFIKHGDPDAILAVAPLVLDDRRELIQKALGWMLREMGKRIDSSLLTDFLTDNAARMGRTALAYAIERMPPDQREHFRLLR